jgi:hypothetical protein
MSITNGVQQVKTTFVGSGAVHKSGGGRGRSLSVFENSDVDKEVGNALRKVKQQVGTTNSPVAEFIDP